MWQGDITRFKKGVSFIILNCGVVKRFLALRKAITTRVKRYDSFRLYLISPFSCWHVGFSGNKFARGRRKPKFEKKKPKFTHSMGLIRTFFAVENENWKLEDLPQADFGCLLENTSSFGKEKFYNWEFFSRGFVSEISLVRCAHSINFRHNQLVRKYHTEIFSIKCRICPLRNDIFGGTGILVSWWPRKALLIHIYR